MGKILVFFLVILLDTWTPGDQCKCMTYLAIKLATKSRLLLAATVPATFPNRTGDHVTVNAEPSEADLARFAKVEGKTVVLTVTHVVEDANVQAVRVLGVRSENTDPHVTLSWAEGAVPAQSNALLATVRGRPLRKAVKLQGVYQVMGEPEEF